MPWEWGDEKPSKKLMFTGANEKKERRGRKIKKKIRHTVYNFVLTIIVNLNS